jgi:hypothetical protein
VFAQFFFKEFQRIKPWLTPSDFEYFQTVPRQDPHTAELNMGVPAVFDNETG